MVTINVGRIEAVFFVVVALVFVATGLVVAYNSGATPDVMGHSAEELEIDLKCTQAYIKGLNLDVVVLDGDGSAVKYVDETYPLWGLKCINGYQKMGCHIENTGNMGKLGSSYDVDLHPSADSCLTDDDELAYSALSITCCMLG
jgi:hypothetical protein